MDPEKPKTDFQKWFDKTPQRFKGIAYLYVHPYYKDVIRLEEDRDEDAHTRKAISICLEMLIKMWNDGQFGEYNEIPPMPWRRGKE